MTETPCRTKYSRPEADAILNKFQLAADFASAPKLFRGAAKSWPPSFERGKGKGKLDDALDFIKDLGKPTGDENKDKPDPKL